MTGWLGTALEPAVVRRALACAAVVGAILIAINHWDAILRGEMTGQRLFQMGLTVLVPYCVSTYSSVSAIRAGQGARVGRHPEAGAGR